MNIVAFIPARGGSKSIPQKNLKELGGKPLIAYSIDSAFKAGIEQVFVSTDSEEIAKVAKEWGAEILMRSPSLAKDDTSMYDVLKSEVPKTKGDLILLLQPTSPFREKVHIKSAISYLTANLEEYDSIVSVEKIPDKYNPAQAIIQTSNGKGMVMGKVSKLKQWLTGKTHTEPTLSGVPISQRLTRRQDHPEAWVPTGSIYLFKASNLVKGSIYGSKVMLLETEPILNLNSQEDWDEAEKQNAKS